MELDSVLTDIGIDALSSVTVLSERLVSLSVTQPTSSLRNMFQLSLTTMRLLSCKHAFFTLSCTNAPAGGRVRSSHFAMEMRAYIHQDRRRALHPRSIRYCWTRRLRPSPPIVLPTDRCFPRLLLCDFPRLLRKRTRKMVPRSTPSLSWCPMLDCWNTSRFER